MKLLVKEKCPNQIDNVHWTQSSEVYEARVWLTDQTLNWDVSPRPPFLCFRGPKRAYNDEGPLKFITSEDQNTKLLSAKQVEEVMKNEWYLHIATEKWSCGEVYGNIVIK